MSKPGKMEAHVGVSSPEPGAETSAAAHARVPAGASPSDRFAALVARLAERARRLTADEWVALALGVLALLLRVWPLGAFSSEYDEGVYWQSLRALTSGHPLFSSVFSSQPPAFLLLLTPFYALFGQSLSAARLGVVVFSLLGPVGLYVAGRALAGRWAGVLAGAFLAFDPLYLTESHTLQAEAPALGFLCVAVAVAALVPRTADARSARWLACGAGVFFALGTLTKLFDVVGIVPIVCYLGQPLWPTFLAPGGRPRWPPADLLRARLAVVRSLGIAALLGAAGLSLVTLLPFAGRWGTLWSQVVAFHLAAASSASHGLRYNLHLLAATLFSDGLLPLALLALLFACLMLLARRTSLAARAWVLLPAALWTLASLLLVLREQPLFVHDITLVTPPLALLAALAFHLTLATDAAATSSAQAPGRGTFLSPATLRSISLSLMSAALALGVVVGAASAVTATRYLPAAEVQMAYILDANTPAEDVIITDDPYAAALADRAVPPQLVDTSSVRIASGYLTAAQLERLITDEDARTILFGSGRFAQIPGFRAWVAARFHLAANLGNGRILYIKAPTQDQPV